MLLVRPETQIRHLEDGNPNEHHKSYLMCNVPNWDVQFSHTVGRYLQKVPYLTCLDLLQLDGVTLDNFAELKTVEGLKEGSPIKVSLSQ